MKNFPITQISTSRTAIDWLKLLSNTSLSPERFHTKADAINFAKRHQITYTTIERVLFRFECMWVIFKELSFLGEDLQFYDLRTRDLCWRKKTVWNPTNVTEAFYWDKESAIASIPLVCPNQISASVFAPNSNSLVFGRRFCATIEELLGE